MSQPSPSCFRFSARPEAEGQAGSPSATEGRGKGPIAARHGLGPWLGLKGGGAGALPAGWMEGDRPALGRRGGRGLALLLRRSRGDRGPTPKENPNS